MECAIATDWIIDEKDLREVGEDKWIDSKTVQTTIPGIEYNITAFPNDDKADKRVVGFSLYVKTKVPITGTFTFSIPSANFSQTLTFSFNDNKSSNADINSCGETFTTRQLFFDPRNRYFINGKLTLKLRGTIKCDDDNGIKSGNTVGQLLYAKDDKDFTFEVDGKKIKAHKFILRQHSPKFAAMFDSGKEEAIQNKVKIEDFSFDIVEEAIRICYDCGLEVEYFSVDELLLLLKFSDVYDIAYVKTYAESYLADEITQNNVCRFVNAAIEFRAEKLQLSCINSLIKYFKNSTAVADIDSLDDAFKAKIATKGFCHVI